MPALLDFETVPELFNGIVNWYRGENRAAFRYKDRTSRTWVDISWEEMEERVHDMAGFLRQEGIEKGARVAILSENRPEWAVTDMATQLLGAVNVSLYTSLPADQAAWILQDSGASVFVVSTSIQQRKAEKIFDECPDLRRIVSMSAGGKNKSSNERGTEHVLSWDDALQAGRAHRSALAEQPGGATLFADVTPDDLSALIYTSGTTGRPKGVMLTHRNFCSNVKAVLGLLPITGNDHHLSFLPLAHALERTGGYLVVMACGATVSYAESIDALSRNLPEASPTILLSVPRVFERLYHAIQKSVEEGSAIQKKVFSWAVATGAKAAERRMKKRAVGPLLGLQCTLAHRLVFSKLHQKLGGKLRLAFSGGAALPGEIGMFFQAAGLPIIEGYGLTETAPGLSFNPVERPRYGTVGHIIPGTTVGIRDLDDSHIIGQLSGDEYPSDLTTGAGEIVARGPNVMKGYWNNPEATRQAIDADGWYHTGDVGRFEDGYLVITDRIKHMIVSAGGKNIYPGPIEDAFKTAPFIDQIVVLGEGREFLAALVTPNRDFLETYAADHGLEAGESAPLIAHQKVLDLFDRAFREYSRTAAAHEKIRAFRLLDEPFSVENGLLTPTLKPRRSRIEAHYAALIADMYEKWRR